MWVFIDDGYYSYEEYCVLISDRYLNCSWLTEIIGKYLIISIHY